MNKPLIVGYGNPLREDDGIGLRAAELVEGSLASGVSDIVQCRQLTPELALRIRSASMVIFLDAALDREPGSVSITPVRSRDSSPWSHHLSPGQLLSLGESAPPAYWITCGASAMGWREGLTAEGEQFAANMAAAALSLLPQNALPERPRAAALAVEIPDPS